MAALRSSSEWERVCNVKVMDPDGWDRTNFTESWAEMITLADFMRRTSVSTVIDHDVFMKLRGAETK